MDTSKRRVAWWLTLVMLMCVATTLRGQEDQRRADSTAVPADSTKETKELKTLFVAFFLEADTVYKMMPDSVITQSDFKAVFGEKSANALVTAGVQSITKNAGHVRVEFGPNGYERDIKYVHVKLKQVVEFDVKSSPSGMFIDNVKGIEADAPILPGHITVKNLAMERDLTTGNITISAHASLWRFISLDYKTTAGPDGKPLSKD